MKTEKTIEILQKTLAKENDPKMKEVISKRIEILTKNKEVTK